MEKLFLGILASTMLLGGVASIAEAKTNFSLYFGTPYYDERIGDDYRYYPNRGWYRDYNYPGSGYYHRPNRSHVKISCSQAKRIVRNQGYRNVVARDCVGRTYSFSAVRRNQNVTIYVNANTGRMSRG
jgi:hypothetical protein